MRSERKAVFLDRDGTLIEDVGILKDFKDIHIFPQTIPALQKLQPRFELFVVTNQTWVSRGGLSLEEAERINKELHRVFLNHGITIREWYVCPHSKEEGCECRKPEAGFLLQAAEQYGLELEGSFIIGDHPHDVITGRSLGVRGLYLLTGHGRKHLHELEPDELIFTHIGEVADWILKHPDV